MFESRFFLPDSILPDLDRKALADRAARIPAGQFHLLADHLPALIAYFDAQHQTCQFANQRYAQTFGFDGQSIIGLTVQQIIGKDAADVIRPHIDFVLRNQLPTSYERQLAAADGATQWAEVNLFPHLDGIETLGAFVLITDITKHRLAEREAHESEERLQKFMQATMEGILFHRDGVVLDANPALCALFGQTLDELRGRSVLDFLPLDQRQRAIDVMAGDQEIAYESQVIHPDGRHLPVEFITRTLTRDGERTRMVIVRDIRDRQVAQERIHHLAHHDPLTGLPNRLHLMAHLEQQITAARQSDSQLALLFIDVDHFKRVNDSLGHLAGDALLQTVARRLTEALRTTDIVARFGGDEFLVLLPQTLQRMDVEDVAKKLLTAIEVPFHVEGRLMSITPSIGVAVFPHDGHTADELLRNADMAMYAAKARGRANFQFFTRDMARTAYAALLLESQMTQALARSEFVLHFQPQVRANDGLPMGAEALIRWNHPERGLLPPDAFIALAEQQRLMLPIGQWVLREAMQCAKRWQVEHGIVMPVAVNLSSMQFQAAGFTSLVERLLREEGVSGNLIEFELTERMLMDDLPEVKRKLHELKALGVRISVDDFGTGYSSLAHLKELPIDKVKIDRSFVHDLPERKNSAAIVRAIVQMSHSLDMVVIAEGVETQAQRDFLAQIGCDELQGMFIGAPVPFDAFDLAIDAVP
jgi:diguanylate cyclase (GGDEF)-like protein/PAS domain S-box-containing protein